VESLGVYQFCVPADINERANAKIEEAKAKQAEYDQEKAALEDAAKAAVSASATLKEHADIRKTTIHEKEQLAEKVEKTETKLVQVCSTGKFATLVVPDEDGNVGIWIRVRVSRTCTFLMAASFI
jgi:hypothetical protein